MIEGEIIIVIDQLLVFHFLKIAGRRRCVGTVAPDVVGGGFRNPNLLMRTWGKPALSLIIPEQSRFGKQQGKTPKEMERKHLEDNCGCSENPSPV